MKIKLLQANKLLFINEYYLVLGIPSKHLICKFIVSSVQMNKFFAHNSLK